MVFENFQKTEIMTFKKSCFREDGKIYINIKRFSLRVKDKKIEKRKKGKKGQKE